MIDSAALAAARDLIRRGTEYGAVFVSVAEEDRPLLAAWYVRERGLPNLAGRAAGKVSAPSGDLCMRCGGIMVRTGTCLTCQGCGESSGGCG